MQHKQAIDMLSVPELNNSEPQIWVDLGCGSGTFTLALAHHLSAGSQIIAVDRDWQALKKIPEDFRQVHIDKRVADFIKDRLSFESLDGILMANSLHYIQYQDEFIDRVKNFLKPKGIFLIVEYDTDRANPWIPYPVPYVRLNELFTKASFSSIQIIDEKPSRYNRSNLYSALLL